MWDVGPVLDFVPQPSLMHEVHLAVEHEACNGEREAGGHPAGGGGQIGHVRIVAAVAAPVDIVEAFVESSDYLFWCRLQGRKPSWRVVTCRKARAW